MPGLFDTDSLSGFIKQISEELDHSGVVESTQIPLGDGTFTRPASSAMEHSIMVQPVSLAGRNSNRADYQKFFIMCGSEIAGCVVADEDRPITDIESNWQEQAGFVDVNPVEYV